jgi:ABC-type nitrate/sulfonate/bicarbonate transport system substrate-binding protein
MHTLSAIITELKEAKMKDRRFIFSNGVPRLILFCCCLLVSMAVLIHSKDSSATEIKKIKISVGRQPWAAGNSQITTYMLENKLFEKHAKDLGYDLTVEYRDYPSAMPQVEAFVGGHLDFGMWGNTPIIRGIAQKQPWSVLNVGEGHFRFVLATRPDSPVRNFEDLKGKTIGALLGGDPYNCLLQMLQLELGIDDPREIGIKFINTPHQAQAATIPKGMDAAIVTYPAFLKAQIELGTVGIANSFGYTEDYYKGPAGEGGGILLENVKKSKFYPDGYYLHRSFWVVQNKIVDQDPNIVVAFIAAQQEAVEALKKMKPEQVSDLALKYWGLPPELGAKVVKDEVLLIRGWVWPTEGDATAVLETSGFMARGGLIEQQLTWQQVKNSLSKGASLSQRAWERSGKNPGMEAFTAKDAPDMRGKPVWQMKDWRDR